MTSATASLLPNGEQQFSDANGVPYEGGKVFFYIPNTSTLKATWQDPLQSVLNANPVVLDGAGRAVIYGSGQYRQVLQDSLGNTVWDKLTSSNLEGGGVFWGGTATGGGNTYNIILGTPATSYYAGMQIAFISDFTNTAAAQVNVTNANGVSLGSVNIYKQGAMGPIVMTGGELVSGNIATAEYDGTEFQLTNGAGGSSSVPLATSSSPGIVQPDGTIITVSSGNITVAKASSTLFGVVKVDNSTIKSTSGVISAAIATSSSPGAVEPDNVTIDISGGIISGAIASSSSFGMVKPDNTTTQISGSSGIISATLIMTALAVGSIIFAEYPSGTPLAPGGTTAAANIHVAVWDAGTSNWRLTGDSISGTWQAMQTTGDTGTEYGLFQRVA